MSASDILLSMGVAANSVASRALDITDTYCEQPVHISITMDLITVSQVRGIKYEPLTLIRPAAIREVNNMTIQSVQQLIYEIRIGKHSLEEAEVELDRIISHPRRYPSWVPPIANASIAPAVVLMFSTNWHVITASFVISYIVDRLLVFLAKRTVVAFFRQIMASAFVTLAAALMAWLGSKHVSFFMGMDSQVIIVGGIVMLLSGLAIVGAVQDAIEEYFVTASARILRVVMMTTGIVIGILVGLYATRKLGINMAVSPNPLSLTALPYQIIAGAAMSAAFALSTHTNRKAITWAGIMGAGALTVLYTSRHIGISSVPATGIAAFAVGFTAQLFSRNWHTPSSGIIADGIVTLVPGLALFTGLMQLVSYQPGNAHFFTGIGTSFTAIGTALAIATGASFGSMLGRPLYRHVTQARNLLPFTDFMDLQIKSDSRRAKLGRLSLKRSEDE